METIQTIGWLISLALKAVILAFLCLLFFFFGWAVIIYTIVSGIPVSPSSDSSVGYFAFASTLLYTVLIVIYVVAGFFVKDIGVDELPPSLRFLASFLRFKDMRHIEAARTGDTIDLAEMARASRERHQNDEDEPGWRRHARQHQYERAAETLEKEADMHRAETEMHKAARRYNQAKAEAEAHRKQRR